MQRIPYSSVWGGISNVTQDPHRKGCVLVTIAGQVLRFQHTTDEELEKLGLLQLTRKNKKVFLIFWEDPSDGKHCLFAGWKNPEDKMVRELQICIHDDDCSLWEAVGRRSPDWKGWDDERT